MRPQKTWDVANQNEDFIETKKGDPLLTTWHTHKKNEFTNNKHTNIPAAWVGFSHSKGFFATNSGPNCPPQVHLTLEIGRPLNHNFHEVMNLMIFAYLWANALFKTFLWE